jgi:hypothetical protein
VRMPDLWQWLDWYKGVDGTELHMPSLLKHFGCCCLWLVHIITLGDMHPAWWLYDTWCVVYVVYYIDIGHRPEANGQGPEPKGQEP